MNKLISLLALFGLTMLVVILTTCFFGNGKCVITFADKTIYSRGEAP